MTTDLIRRLNAGCATGGYLVSLPKTDALMKEAADALEAAAKRIAELEDELHSDDDATLGLLDEVERLQNLCLNIGGERDEAREAVRVLVEALEAAYTEEWAPAPPTYGWGELACAALADPRVRKIVDGNL